RPDGALPEDEGLLRALSGAPGLAAHPRPLRRATRRECQRHPLERQTFAVCHAFRAGPFLALSSAPSSTKMWPSVCSRIALGLVPRHRGRDGFSGAIRMPSGRAGRGAGCSAACSAGPHMSRPGACRPSATHAVASEHVCRTVGVLKLTPFPALWCGERRVVPSARRAGASRRAARASRAGDLAR
ncbi:MAG: hypothetical protein JWO86_703, partial [Myxococcaceae bacterium]|nr:hypothetical protein [Myxococcaceae bacterium]